MDACNGSISPGVASCSDCYVDPIALRIHPFSLNLSYEARRQRQHQASDKLLCYLQLAAALYALLAVWIDHGNIMHSYYLLGTLALDISQAYLLRYHPKGYMKQRSSILTLVHFARLISHWQGAKANPRATLLHLKAPTTFSHVSIFLLLCKVFFSSGLVQYLPLIYAPINFHSHLLIQTLTFYHLVSAAAAPLVCALTRDGLATSSSKTYHLTRLLALPTSPPFPAAAGPAALNTTSTTCTTSFSSSSHSMDMAPSALPILPTPSPPSIQNCSLPSESETLILLVLLLQLFLGFFLPLYLTYMLDWHQKVSYLLPQLPAITVALQQPQQQANKLVVAAAAASHQHVTQLVTELRGCSSQVQQLRLLCSRRLTDREHKLLLLLLEDDARRQQQQQQEQGLDHKGHNQQQQDSNHTHHDQPQQHKQEHQPRLQQHPDQDHCCQQQQQQEQQGQAKQQQQQQKGGLEKGGPSQYSSEQKDHQHGRQQEEDPRSQGDALPLQWGLALSLFGYWGGMPQAALLHVLLLSGLLLVALVVVEGPLGRRLQLIVQQQLQEQCQGCI